MLNPIPATPNLEAYWKADVGVCSDAAGTTPATDGQAVLFWSDQGPHGFHLARKTTDPTPTLTASSFFKGRPAVAFAAASHQYLYNAAFNKTVSATAGTWVVAFRATLSTAAGPVWPANNGFAVDDESGNLYFWTNSGNYEFGKVHHTSLWGKLVVARYDGSQPTSATRLRVRVNRTDRVPVYAGSAIGTTLPPGAAGIYVGKQAANPSYLDGLVLEAAYFSRALSDPEIAAIEAYHAAVYFAQGQSKVHVLGDSIPHGYPDHQTDGLDWPTLLGAALGPPWTVQNVSVIAYTTAQLENSFTSQVDPDRDEWRVNDLVIVESGTNNLAQNQTAAAALAEMTTSVAARHAQGFAVAVQTLLPRQDAANMATFGQTQGGFDAGRASYNASVLAGSVGSDYAFDLASNPGFTTLVGNPNYYQGDLVHTTAVGNAAIAAAAKALVLGPYAAPAATTCAKPRQWVPGRARPRPSKSR